MAPSPETAPRPLGLRERKKAKTRAAIQEHALRLFAEQGYSETTIEQIAEAAEVSPSTFFRYFPTKEDVVLFDSTDPLMLAAFERQPPELTVIEALRRAFRDAYEGLSKEQVTRELQRQRLMRTVPEVRGRMLSELMGAIDLLAEVVADRVGRSATDIAVRTFAGAAVGVIMGVVLAVPESDQVDYVELFDSAMKQLEAGLPL